MKIKFCPNCKKEKPVSEFYKHKSRADGRTGYCKPCHNHKSKLTTSKNFNPELEALRIKIFSDIPDGLTPKQQKKYWKDHPEYQERYVTECRKINSKKKVKKVKIYKQRDENKALKYRKEWYRKNKDKHAKYYKEYYQNNKEKLTEYRKDYFKTAAGAASRKKSRQKYRALKAGASVEDFSHLEIFARDEYRCQICNRKTRPDFKNLFHPLYPNLDHIIPLSKGGDHSRQNTQCLCRQCNIEKNNKENFGDQMRLFG